MNIPLPEEENFKITNNYYIIIKQISEDFSKYIINFKMYSSDYLKKIDANNKKFDFNNFEKKYKDASLKDLDLHHIFSISSLIPKIIKEQIINLGYFITEIDQKYNNFEKIYNLQSSKYLEQYNNYKEIKNELNKKYREIERLKVNYITNISSVEEMVHKFYQKKNSNKKRLNSISSASLSEFNKKESIKIEQKIEQNNISIEEQVNNNIIKVKKIEEDYKANIALAKSLEDKYMKISKESKDNLRKILCELLNGYKDFIIDCMVFLKNCYKVPLSEVDTYMNDFNKLNEYEIFDKIILSSYKPNKDLININPQKYTLKFFRKNNNEEENEYDEKIKIKNKIKKSNSAILLEEGFQEMDYSQEEEIFLTIKKMTENFELLDSNNFDLVLEEQKLRCKYLTLKLLAFAPISKLYSDKIPTITDDEIIELEKLIDNKKIREIFIQQMSQFRTRGIFEIPEREYGILCQLFNKIFKNIETDMDYESAINLIILSQTYYIIKDGKKEYLQKQIMNNDFLKTKKFWEMYAKYSITKAVSNCVIQENAEDKEIEESFSNIVFAQILPMTDNMIDFGLDINFVEEIIIPFISKYKIGPELAVTITSVIEAKKLEAQEKNNKDNNIKIEEEKKEK